MHYDASLRVRELTQNIYDIGDEIAEHIDYVAQSIADWDVELVDDCLHELRVVVEQGRTEVRPGLAELNGLRQAFVSGVRAGEMSNSFAHPGRTLSFLRKKPPHPPAQPEGAGETGVARVASEKKSDDKRKDMASTATWRLWLREQSDEAIRELRELADWVVAQTGLAMDAQPVLLPQAYSKAERRTHEIAEHWRESIERQGPLARSMRGEAPPPFLQERARIERLITKLNKRRGKVV